MSNAARTDRNRAVHLAAELGRHMKFLIADKNADANQIISSIVTVFTTNDADKHAGDAIIESYTRDNEVLGRNDGWASDETFRQGYQDYGQRFDISRFGIAAQNVGAIKYNWSMSTDDSWNAGFVVYITLANGNVYSVGGHYYNIHENAKSDTISLGW